MCVALVGTVEAIEGEGVQRQAKVRIGDQLRTVNLAFVPEAMLGDRIVVHSGIAIRKQRAASPERRAIGE